MNDFDRKDSLIAAALLLQQNRPAEAIDRLLPLYRRDPLDADVAINLGGAYILQRKWNRAVRVLRTAAEAQQGNVMLWVNLAAAELGRLELSGPKQQDRAIRAYEKALEIDAQTPNVHYHLGLIYKERRQYRQAEVFFQRALEVRPTDQDARMWRRKMKSMSSQEGSEKSS